ncbi:hypothetical protein D5086_031682 [Populus alba]|uniref:Uncharacterized protein n=1 Tax=Populus alba TaxID=43335 RepID=A0ACC4AJA5_POPAL
MWIEGEGMLHALCFDKDGDGKFYSIAENHIPQEIDIFSLQTLGDWDIKRNLASTFQQPPKGTGELVVFGVDAMKPFMELGIVSADGKRLVHKADLKFNRCTLSHDMGVTERYNVIMDFPLTIRYYRDSSRKAVSAITLTITLKLIKFEKEEYARIGIMPRYGNADSIRWFEVEPNCTFHILNCFEEGDEVVVRGIAGMPKFGGLAKVEWEESEGHIKVEYHEFEGNTFCTGAAFVPERSPFSSMLQRAPDTGELVIIGVDATKPFLELGVVSGMTCTDSLRVARKYSNILLYFMCIVHDLTNELTQSSGFRWNQIAHFTFFIVFDEGTDEILLVLKNKYGYTQATDSNASSDSGMPKHGGLAKLYFEEPETNKISSQGGQSEELIKVEYHNPNRILSALELP